MKSKKLENDLTKHLKFKIPTNKEKKFPFDEDEFILVNESELRSNPDNPMFPEFYLDDLIGFDDTFQKLFETSIEESYYWEHCSFKTYEELFESRLNVFLLEFVDGDVKNFINEEMNVIYNSFVPETDEFHSPYGDVFPGEPPHFVYNSFYGAIKLDINHILLKKIEMAYHKKLEFLHTKLNKLNSQVIVDDNEDSLLLLDEEKIKIGEKIILLKELGVLDFLKEKEPFSTSNNALSNIVSLITGENGSTIQSYINPIYSKGIEQKNNPLSKTRNVSKVRSKLLDIGFQLK